ncbi:hypothetical protein TNCV_700901 [Trichonephila clavipes]|nr:hypothetical protein TNCV_700901 [Trichonephila clavipes]
MDHVFLNHGQVTWMTSELAPPLLTTTPKRGEASVSCTRAVNHCPAELGQTKRTILAHLECSSGTVNRDVLRLLEVLGPHAKSGPRPQHKCRPPL